MKTIDEARLSTDLAYRFTFLADFIGFSAEDAQWIMMSAPYLGPHIGLMVDKTYQKLLAFDLTARHFLPRQSGYDGPLPDALGDLRPTHPQIQFRREHLARYFQQILGRTIDGKLVGYLDMVGKIHTPRAGNAEINVPLLQMNALMGLIGDIILETLMEQPIDPQTLIKTVRAFQKFLWIQNDFVTRHYSGDAVPQGDPTPAS